MRTLFRPVLCLTVTALVVPMVAFATPPTTEAISFDDTFVYAPGTDENPCSFELTYHNEGTYLVTTHLDSSGVAVRQFARGIDFLDPKRGFLRRARSLGVGDGASALPELVAPRL